MKKVLLILLLMICSLGTISCDNNVPSYLKYDTFFTDENLVECHLNNLPQPKLENSVLYNNNGKLLYLNLTQEEFFNYLNEVSNFILGKENVYYKSLEYESELSVGPLLLPIEVKVFIPLIDNKDFSQKGECFAFSLSDKLSNGWINNSMKEIYKVNIKWFEGELKDINFKYTCYIEIGKVDFAKFETCAKEHKFNENFLSYPVPNTNIIIDIYSCDYCGYEKQSEYYGGDSTTTYSKIITKGSEYVEYECYQQYLVNPTCFPGLTEHIKIPKSTEFDFEVRANGFSIPVVYEENNILVYGFIFPMCDVEIEIIAIEK